MFSLDPSMLWRQFGASIDMLDSALRDCPDELWQAPLWPDRPGDPPGFSAFWYLAYHCLFWLDLYLYGAEEGFAPPPPYDLIEMDPAGLIPPTYTKEQVLGYLSYCRAKCQAILTGLTPEQAARPCRFPWGEVSYVELQLYSLRHVQEHGAQLRLFLGQQSGIEAKWFGKARS